MERRPTYEELQANVRRMAERIAYLERLLWGGRRDKRVMQGPILFDAFFNEAAEAREVAIASTVREIRKEAEKRRASAGPDVICMPDFRKNGGRNPPKAWTLPGTTSSAGTWSASCTAARPVYGWSAWSVPF